MHPGIFQTLYVRIVSGGKNNSCQYRPALGAEQLILNALDVSDVIAEYETRLQECKDIMVPQGNAGERICHSLFNALRIPELIRAIASMRADDARDIVREMMHALMSHGCEFAQELQEKHRQAEQAQDAMESVVDVLDEKDGVTQELYLDWALAVEHLNQAVETLKSQEKVLIHTLQEIDSARPAWAVISEGSHPAFQEALRFLQGDMESFIMRTMWYRGEADRAEEMRPAIEQARGHIRTCKEIHQAAQETWNTQHHRIHEQILPITESIRSALASLEEATQRFADYEKRFSKDVPRPHETQGRLITEDEYECALTTLKDPQWGPVQAKRRFTHLMDGILAHQSKKPGMPGNLSTAIHQAEQQIAKIEASWSRRTNARETSCHSPEQPALPSEPQPTSSPSESPTSLHDETARTETFLSDKECVMNERTEELYELILCVGYVLTFLPNRFFAANNIRSMLRLVSYLGKCTERETALYYDALMEIHRRDRTLVDHTSDILPMQAHAPTTWIYYKTKFWFVKLTAAGSVSAQLLLKKHWLTPIQIKEAHTRYRQEQYERYQES